jgi:hypothetical protein
MPIGPYKGGWLVMTPQVAEVEIATDADVDAAIRRALDEAGVTFEELREQARVSRFSSERARRAWFVVSSFVEQG